MTYSEFLQSFLSGMHAVLSWIRNNFFGDMGYLFDNHLIFTLMGISIILFMIEEFMGLLTSFRFGGLFFRRFGIFTPRSYRTDYTREVNPDYTKEEHPKPYRIFYRSRVAPAYFMKYNGRYYQVYRPRYNPFAIARFNAAYKAGSIVSYNQLYNSKGSPLYNQRYKDEYNPSSSSPLTANNIRASMSGSASSNNHYNPRMVNRLVNAYNDVNSENHFSTESEELNMFDGLGEELEEAFSHGGSSTQAGMPGDWFSDKGILASEMSEYFEGLNNGEYPDTMDPSDFL